MPNCRRNTRMPVIGLHSVPVLYMLIARYNACSNNALLTWKQETLDRHDT